MLATVTQVSFSQEAVVVSENRQVLTDEQLMDIVQRQTFRYFWDFGHPVSGLARERSNRTHYGDEVVTIGGTGFSVMAMIVAAERKYESREKIVERLLLMLAFLEKADRYHGIFPHWLNGETGKTIPFSEKDNGADLVETSYLFQGLLAAKEYFNGENPEERQLSNRIGKLWREADFSWFTRNGENVLYWHWSPTYGWAMNHKIQGWNECLITYVMAAASPTHGIKSEVYHKGWKSGKHYLNGKRYFDVTLPLGFDYGGPLFFAHYSFLGLDPQGLKEGGVDFWEQNKAHTEINYRYCVANPKKFEGYGSRCWGLTSSDSPNGYDAHSPENDLGVISPTAAISSMPYTPGPSMQAMRYFYGQMRERLWSKYGFYDAFSPSTGWVANSHLAIDQGPIIIMLENHRTGLLWKYFMRNEDVKSGLRKLGFESPHLTM